MKKGFLNTGTTRRLNAASEIKRSKGGFQKTDDIDKQPVADGFIKRGFLLEEPSRRGSCRRLKRECNSSDKSKISDDSLQPLSSLENNIVKHASIEFSKNSRQCEKRIAAQQHNDALQNSSQVPDRNSKTTTPSGIQAISNETKTQQLQISCKKRVVTRSTALLDIEQRETLVSNDNDGAVDDRKQFHPHNFYDAGEEAYKADNSPNQKKVFEVNLIGRSRKMGETSPDERLQLSSHSSSPPHLVIPSSLKSEKARPHMTTTSGNDQKPLIIEVIDSKNNKISSDSDTSIESTLPKNIANLPGQLLIRDTTNSSYSEEQDVLKQHQGLEQWQKRNNLEADHHDFSHESRATREQISVHFANEVHVFLSKLRRSLKKKSNSRSDDHALSTNEARAKIEVFVNKDSVLLVKIFIKNHFGSQLSDRSSTGKSNSSKLRSCQSKVEQLWSIILESAAQDYTTMYKKRHKTTISTTSSPLALGLGILEFLGPGIGLKSLEPVISSSISQSCILNPGVSEDSKNHEIEHGKYHKILALGGIYIVKCWIRCIDVTLIELETAWKSNNDNHIANLALQSKLNGLLQEHSVLIGSMVPTLERIATTTTSFDYRRSILMTAAEDASFEAIEVSARFFVLFQIIQPLHCQSEKSGKNSMHSEMLRLMIHWRDVLPSIERLLVARRHLTSKQKAENLCDSVYHDKIMCATSVLNDWLNLIKFSKLHFFDYIVVGNCGENIASLHEGADFNVCMNLFSNLAGVQSDQPSTLDDLESNQTQSKLSSVCAYRIGGIAYCLSRNRGNNLYRCNNSLYVAIGDAGIKHLILLLLDAKKSTEFTRNTENKAEAWQHLIHERVFVRAFNAWLSKQGKTEIISLGTKTRPGSSLKLVDEALSYCTELIRSESKPCIDLSLAAISALILPSSHEFSNITTTDMCPKMLTDAMEALSNLSRQNSTTTLATSIGSGLDPSTRAMCVIITKIVVINPSQLFPFVLAAKFHKEIMVEIALNLLSLAPPPTINQGCNETLENVGIATQMLQGGQELNKPVDFVHYSASKIIVENISSVDSLRSRIKANPSLFCAVSCTVTVPQIVACLTKEHDKPEEVSTLANSALSELLCYVMEAHAVNEADEFVHVLVQSVLDLEYSTQQSVFGKCCPLWRSALLHHKNLTETAYGNMLVASAKVMEEMPSSSTPLALYSSLVETDDIATIGELHTNAHDTDRRISIAASSVLKFASNRLRLHCNNYCLHHESVGRHIFEALSPLLILRRMPRSYYFKLHRDMVYDAEIEMMLRNLAHFLAEKLKNLATRNEQSQIAKEEKKLLAELAGHCLPLTDPSSKEDQMEGTPTQPLSLFEAICKDTFEDTLKLLFGRDNEKSRSITMRRVIEAKAALYSICHHLPLAHDDEAGEPLLHTASFALDVLDYQDDAGTNELSESDAKEVSMLQTGCIQYLAICFDSLSFRMTRRAQQNRSPTLITEIETGNESGSSKERTCSILSALTNIMSAVKSILSSAKSPTLDASLLHQISDPRTSRRLSPAAFTSILNSIALLSQNSRSEDSRLEWFAANMMPTLVVLINSHYTDNESNHPLFIAASLQAVYTLLARLGSFDWLSSNQQCSDDNNRKREEDFTCSILRGALNSFKERSDNDATASTVRLAASKVMLTVIAIHKSSPGTSPSGNEIGFLDRAEVREAMSELCRAANVDRSPEVRRLIAEAIPGLFRILDES